MKQIHLLQKEQEMLSPAGQGHVAPELSLQRCHQGMSHLGVWGSWLLSSSKPSPDPLRGYL